ncbi:hypothetical protein [Mucilaginibacter myungsuensis]|uniref:Uncharacterized protein n=1 Tax=Mucilaginibacter myungsuensis TaxID=649104 RepID=A0A929PY85_9SPHI|nr:hypothetical protein [Mucilaginibacter myungsuensis]MBE9663966.1 hypothetical protein [Mucilaginibacter myungsuensis]MDN3598318.1 hypothetical protein [Mucilaginibacter myungsuensis]
MIRFIISFLIFTAIVAVAPLVLMQTGYALWIHPLFWKMFVFFGIVTFVVSQSVLLAQQRDSKTGVQVFLAATVVKLLACMTFALIYALNKPESRLPFIGGFFYLYFVYTAFEIYSLLSNLRDQIKR